MWDRPLINWCFLSHLCYDKNVKMFLMCSIILKLFVCSVNRLFTLAPSRARGFASMTIFTLASRTAVLRLWGGLTCMLRIWLYRREAMEGEKRGIENISFRWMGKLECQERTTTQSQVNYWQPSHVWITTLVRISSSCGGPNPLKVHSNECV